MRVARNFLECADVSALWNGATCRAVESGVMPPHSKFSVEASMNGLYRSSNVAAGK
jgi:hypothetical protein